MQQQAVCTRTKNILLLYCILCSNSSRNSSNAAPSDEHVHIKVHMPEVKHKHTHLQTVLQHEHHHQPVVHYYQYQQHQTEKHDVTGGKQTRKKKMAAATTASTSATSIMPAIELAYTTGTDGGVVELSSVSSSDNDRPLSATAGYLPTLQQQDDVYVKPNFGPVHSDGRIKLINNMANELHGKMQPTSGSFLESGVAYPPAHMTSKVTRTGTAAAGIHKPPQQNPLDKQRQQLLQQIFTPQLMMAIRAASNNGQNAENIDVITAADVDADNNEEESYIAENAYNNDETNNYHAVNDVGAAVGAAANSSDNVLFNGNFLPALQTEYLTTYEIWPAERYKRNKYEQLSNDEIYRSTMRELPHYNRTQQAKKTSKTAFYDNFYRQPAISVGAAQQHQQLQHYYQRKNNYPQRHKYTTQHVDDDNDNVNNNDNNETLPLHDSAIAFDNNFTFDNIDNLASIPNAVGFPDSVLVPAIPTQLYSNVYDAYVSAAISQQQQQLPAHLTMTSDAGGRNSTMQPTSYIEQFMQHQQQQPEIHNTSSTMASTSKPKHIPAINKVQQTTQRLSTRQQQRQRQPATTSFGSTFLASSTAQTHYTRKQHKNHIKSKQNRSYI